MEDSRSFRLFFSAFRNRRIRQEVVDIARGTRRANIRLGGAQSACQWIHFHAMMERRIFHYYAGMGVSKPNDHYVCDRAIVSLSTDMRILEKYWTKIGQGLR